MTTHHFELIVKFRHFKLRWNCNEFAELDFFRLTFTQKRLMGLLNLKQLQWFKADQKHDVIRNLKSKLNDCPKLETYKLM